MTQSGILLESGTNELELVEFTVGPNRYGINVVKVREILIPTPVTPIPYNHPNIKGVVDIRGEILPVVNLPKALGLPEAEITPSHKYIVTEFNSQKFVFLVDSVDKINRFSWERIEKPSNIYQHSGSQVFGMIRKEDEIVLLLDFEKIITDINPSSGMNTANLDQLTPTDRSAYRVVVTEDSVMLRTLIEDTLRKAGFEKLVFFDNGLSAFEYLEEAVANGSDIKETADLIISDIEMPKMDGLAFTKKVNDDARLAKLPVVIFSSLITDDLRHKGQMVGADAQVSKPEIVELIQIIDSLIQ